MNNSRNLTIKNAKLSQNNFYMILNIWRDFQICISVPLRYHSMSLKMGGPNTTTFGSWFAVFYLFHMEMRIQSLAFLLINLFYKVIVLLWRKTRLLPCDLWRTILCSIMELTYWYWRVTHGILQKCQNTLCHIFRWKEKNWGGNDKRTREKTKGKKSWNRNRATRTR